MEIISFGRARPGVLCHAKTCHYVLGAFDWSGEYDQVKNYL